jgi:hypothetical protein
MQLCNHELTDPAQAPGAAPPVNRSLAHRIAAARAADCRRMQHLNMPVGAGTGPGVYTTPLAPLHMDVWLMLVLVAVAPAAAAAASTSAFFPDYAERFTVHTREYDTAHGVTVEQTIASDDKLQRAMMLAKGSMVRGVLQQITRCDIHPVGWFVQVAGPTTSQLQCQNVTRTCQWSKFWTAPPPNATMTDDNINGTACIRWEWWDAGEKMAFWGTQDTPLRTSKLFSSHTGWAPWTIDFTDFVAAAPKMDAFAPLPGAKCPPATGPPPTAQQGMEGGVRRPAGAEPSHLKGTGPGLGARLGRWR